MFTSHKENRVPKPTRNLPIVISNLSHYSYDAAYDCDVDCDGGDACSLPTLDMKEFSGLEKKYIYVPEDGKNTPIDDDFCLFYGPFQHVALLNSEAKKLLNLFSAPRDIAEIDHLYQDTDPVHLEKTLTALIESRLLSSINSVPRVQSAPSVLSAWLHITDRCNLRCEYCYLPHLKHDMSLEIGRASIDAIFRSAKQNGFNKIKLKYAGGEALLLWPLVENLHQYALEKGKKHNIDVQGVVLSNGTLMDANISDSINSMGLKLMISLDGLGSVQDAHRPYAGGRGTFEDVLKGIDFAISSGVTPNISITISGKNAYGLPDIVDWVLNKDLPFSLNFYRENDLSKEKDDLLLEESRIIDGMLAAYKVIEENLPRASLLASLVDRANLSAAHNRTCSVGENYMVFDYRGQISKCQMLINQPVSNINANDPLAEIRQDKIGIQNLHVDEKEGCKSCEWKYWCTGGCSLSTFRATGRYDVKSPNCEIYKAIYPEAIRLEGLRLLKYFKSHNLH